MQVTTYTLYEDMLKQPHLLVAGATGSGKSVVINGIMHEALVRSASGYKVEFILIDPKRVELVTYKELPNTIYYASEPEEMRSALQYAMKIIDDRYTIMQNQRVKKFGGGDIYIVIDEFADLMTTDRKNVMPLIQRIAQVGRAAKVHLIIATQTPIAKVLPTEIKCNFDSRVALRTRSAQDSRNILGVKCAETLPRYGKAYYMTPENMDMVLCDIPMVEDTKIEMLVNRLSAPKITEQWTQKKQKKNFFERYFD